MKNTMKENPVNKLYDILIINEDEKYAPFYGVKNLKSNNICFLIIELRFRGCYYENKHNWWIGEIPMKPTISGLV